VAERKSKKLDTAMAADMDDILRKGFCICGNWDEKFTGEKLTEAGRDACPTNVVNGGCYRFVWHSRPRTRSFSDTVPIDGRGSAAFRGTISDVRWAHLKIFGGRRPNCKV
jgi:hypothetical protein